MMKLIRDWLKEQLSYTEIANKITELDPLIFSKWRAENIAVSELWNAFEYWKYRTMTEFEQDWDIVEKKWSTVNDERVRPSHMKNQSDWWIWFDERFSWTNSLIAPAPPRCRCATVYRIL